jgi:hypothetical protein
MRKIHLTTKVTKDTKVSDVYYSELRALRVLRGENFFPFGCGSAALGPLWLNFFSASVAAQPR